jgi:hypothetical protein
MNREGRSLDIVELLWCLWDYYEFRVEE